jgi:hypothetical protein
VHRIGVRDAARFSLVLGADDNQQA